MNAILSILAMVVVLTIAANRTILHYAIATVLGIPLLAHAVKSVALAIAPVTIIPQWMLIVYAVASLLLIATCCLWLAANRTPASISEIKQRRIYASQARQRVRRRVRFVTQEKPS